jgi:hypothetical protein
VGILAGVVLLMAWTQGAVATTSISAQWAAWLAQRDDAAALKVRWNPDHSQIRSVQGLLLPSSSRSSRELGISEFVDQVLRVQGIRREHLGRVQKDGTRNRATWSFPQLYDGLPVEDHALVLKVRRDGALVGMENNLARFSKPPTPLILSAKEARIRALEIMDASYARQSAKAAPALVILPFGNAPVRAWRVPVTAWPHGLYCVYVRADDGRILWVRDQMIR